MRCRQTRRNGFIAATILLFITCFNGPVKGEDLRFCTPNTKNQDIFKLSQGVLAEAFSRLEYNFSLVTYPAKRCPIEVNHGNIDGDSHRILKFDPSHNYPNLVRVEASIQTIDQSIFTKNPEIRPSGWKGLKPYKVLYLPGIKIIEFGLSRAAVPEENRIGVASHKQAFEMLLQNRGDLIVVNSSTGNQIIENLNLGNRGIRLLKPPLVTFDLYPYMHKKHKHLANKLALTIEGMKRDGTYARIVSNCLGSKINGNE